MNRPHDPRPSRAGAPLCPACDRPAKSMGVVKGWEWFLCVECECQYKIRVAGKAVRDGR